MLKSLKNLIAILCSMLIFLSSGTTCLANGDIYKNKGVLTAIKNQNATMISEFAVEDVNLAKSMRDAYFIAVPYDNDKTAYENAWNFYMEYKQRLCDLNGDFSMFSKKELSEAILFVTSFAIDARNISGYSIINELLGKENIIQIRSEGIESVCFAYMALTCHNEYIAISKEEEKQLLNTILDHKYDNINDLSCALLALSSAENTYVLKKWKEEKINQIIELYKNQNCSTEEVSKIIIFASACNINVNDDNRFYKDGKSILEDLYNRIEMDNSLEKREVENILNALISYERYCMGVNSIYVYNKNENLRSDDNYINSEIYDYIMNESDISEHWSKEKFIELVFNSSIPYDYEVNKNFSPNDAITRGEFISWISKYKNMNKSDANYFSDINNQELSKIVNGFTEECILGRYQLESEKTVFLNYFFGGVFRSNDLITREEAAFLLKCAYGYIDLPEKETDLIRNFSDYNSCDEKYNFH